MANPLNTITANGVTQALSDYEAAKNINSSVLIGQLSGMIGQKAQWITQVKGEDGKMTKQSFEGKIIGVSITDGEPSVIADVNGKTHQVKISELVRIGDLSAQKPAPPPQPTP